MSKWYFAEKKEEPQPLVAVAAGRVRFQEVDSLRIVWHGHYASYFEDGRVAFGERYGLTYQNFMLFETPAPIVQYHCDFKAPLCFADRYTVETRLHWSEAARLNFSYVVKNEQGLLCATGCSVQLLTDLRGTMLLLSPEWLESFRQYWQSGQWQHGKWQG